MALRHPRILDVVRAVTAVAPDHDGVRAWWYAPPLRLRLEGELPQAREKDQPPKVEVVIEPHEGARPDLDAIARALAAALGTSDVSVRARAAAGSAEARPLFRLLSNGVGGDR